jgi:hypothetical protein
VTDDEPILTLPDRVTAAGLSADRIEQHMTAGVSAGIPGR